MQDVDPKLNYDAIAEKIVEFHDSSFTYPFLWIQMLTNSTGSTKNAVVQNLQALRKGLEAEECSASSSADKAKPTKRSKSSKAAKADDNSGGKAPSSSKEK